MTSNVLSERSDEKAGEAGTEADKCGTDNKANPKTDETQI